MKQLTWSYSSIKTYEQCPKKYYHLKIAKDAKDDQNAEHLIYGKRFHEAAEFYVKGTAPLPPEFNFAKSTLDNLKNRPGEKLCEYEMGLTANLEPCGFHADDMWWHGIADLIILEGDTARILDYKTSKSAKYADTGQLELMSLAVFKHFPQIKKVKAGLLFVISKDFVKANYNVEDVPKLWEKWLRLYGSLQFSYENNRWNPKTSGLCKKHCVVFSCPHNGRTE